MPSHIIPELRDMKEIAYVHSGLYEKAHKIFKDAYKQTPKGHETALNKTIWRNHIRKSCTKLVTKVDMHLTLNF